MLKLKGQQKVSSIATISSIHVGFKSRLFVLLCCMVSISIMRPTLKGYIIKLKVDFFNGYRDNDRCQRKCTLSGKHGIFFMVVFKNL